MTDIKIAHQGIEGAYSHMAAISLFPNYKTLSFPSFDEALNAVKSNIAQYAVVPIENSAAGRVADIHSLLPDSNLFIIGEHYQKIEHQLLAPQSANIDNIKSVHSHIQALSQCKKSLSNIANFEKVIEPNTAIAAKKISLENNKTKAVIASKLAGKIYGLKTLKENIEDRANNTTRFLIIAKEPQTPKFNSEKVITTFIFKVKSIPAALYKCLGGFATNSINMTKIESYVTNEDFIAAQFYVDVEAHPDEKRFKYALDELKFFSDKVKILGTYKAKAH